MEEIEHKMLILNNKIYEHEVSLKKMKNKNMTKKFTKEIENQIAIFRAKWSAMDKARDSKVPFY